MSEEQIRKLNGAAARAGIEGWVIALLPSHTVIGRPMASLVSSTAPTTHLSPALEFVGAIVPAPNGRGLSQQFNVGPLCGLISIDGIDLPPGTPCIALDLLHELERTSLGRLVEARLEMIRVLRAELNGITLVPAGAKLPPLPGERRS